MILWHISSSRMPSWSITVRQWHDRSWFGAPPMLVHKYVDENGLAALLAAKRSASVTPEMSHRECTSCMPPPSANQAVHSGFESQRRHCQKSKTGVSVAPQRTCVHQKFKIKNDAQYLCHINFYTLNYDHHT